MLSSFVQKVVIITNFSHKKVRIRICFGFSLDPRHYFDDVGKRKVNDIIYDYRRTNWQKMDYTLLVLISLRVHTIFFSFRTGPFQSCAAVSRN